MKKLFFLLMACLVMGVGDLWADTVQELKLDNGATQTGTYFTVAKASGSPSYNNAYTGKYEGTTYSKGLKMESGTTITFTTTASSSTVIIVQATKKSGNDNTGGINFDGTNYAHTTASTIENDANNENVRVYTFSDVSAGSHTIARNSESGLFYVKVVEKDDTQTLTTVAISTTWTFTSANNIMGTSSLDATTIKSNMEFIATGGTKITQNTDDINLGGSAAYLHFKAPANCTVTVTAHNPNTSSDRYLHISTGSKDTSNDQLSQLLTGSDESYQVSLTEAADVYVYCSGGGIRIASVTVTDPITPMTPTLTISASGDVTVSEGHANVNTGSVITLSSSFAYDSNAIDASNFDVVYNIINLSSDANAATISGDQLSVGHAAGKFQVQAVATSKSLLYDNCTTTVEFQVNNTGSNGDNQDEFAVSDFGYADNANGTNSSNNQLDRTLKGFSFVFTEGEAVKYNNNNYITLRRSGDSYGKLAINEDNQGKCEIYKADITYRSTADATLTTNATTAEGGETLFLPSTSGEDKTISMLLGRSFFTMQMASDATVLIKSVKLYYNNSSLDQEPVTPILTFSPATVTAIPGSDVAEPTLTTSPKTLKVTYSSSNTSVATVDETTGEVTAVTTGTATITATYAGTTTYLNSANGTYTITVASVPEAVTFTPNSGAVASGTTVTLATATADATIYYTTDGSAPTDTSTQYTASITITSAQTIRAIAVNTAGSSAISSATYTIAAAADGLQTITEHDWTFDSDAFDKDADYGYALVDGKTLEIFGSKNGKENNFQKSSTAIQTSNGDESFNYYMKFENSRYNSSEANAKTLSDNNRRYFHFKVNAEANQTKIVLYGSTGSNGSERSGKIAVGSFDDDHVVATLTNSNSKQAATIEYTFTETGEKDVWVYSPSNAFQFYKILVTSDKQALTTFRSMGNQTYDYTSNQTFNHTIYIQPENAISEVNEITVTSSDANILDVSNITKNINTTTGRLVIGGIKANEGGTATLTVNFAGNTNYAAATYTTRAFNVTGPTHVLISAEDQDIQQGQHSQLTPVITDKNGSPIGIKEVNGSYVTYVLGEDEEEPDYSTYFDITYTAGTGSGENYNKITIDATGKIETEDDSMSPATMAEVGAYRYVTVTATPKAAYASAFTTSDAISTTVKLTIIEKVSQVQVDLYWDEACKTNKISTLTGEEWSISTTYASKDENKLYTFDQGIFARGFPNGRMIYAKVRNGNDSIWFSYAQNAIPATIPANPKVDKKKRIFEYRRGLPIYFDGSLSDGDYIQVNIVATKWNAETKKRELDGSVARMKFLIVSHDRPEKPTYSPVSPDADPSKNNTTDATFDNTNGGKIMDTSQNVVAYGEGASDGVTGARNIVYGKFSTESIYTTEQLINEQNVQRGIDNVPVVSTEVAKRRFTSVQIKSYTDDYGTADYISQQTYTEYWYLYDTRMTLTPAGNQYINISGQPTPNATTQPTTNVVWYNKITKKWHDVLNQTVTYSIIDRNGADGTTIDTATGVVTAGTSPGWVRVKALYNVADEWHGGDSNNAQEAGNEPQYKSTTAPSETYFYVYIADPSQEEPEITPPTRKFTSSQAYIVKAPGNWDVRYTIDGSGPSATNGNFLGHGSTAENNTTATITVKAIAFNPANTSQTSRIVSETYTLVNPIPDPIFDPDGVTAPWYYNTSNLIVQIACAYGGAEIYYTIDGSDPVIGAENTFKYSGLEKVTISGNVAIKAVAYSRTDDIYSNVVTSNYVYTTDMNLPYFQISTDGTNWYGYDYTNSWVANGTHWNIGQSHDITPSTQIRIIDPNTVKGTIYYTTNGTAPAANSSSMIYKEGNPFTVAKTTTGKAIVTLEEASSEVATAVFNIDANTYHVWEAVESTTPGGKMTKEAGFVITTKPSLIVSNSMTDVNTNSIATSDGGSNSENITYAQPYITATFGGYDTNDWEHMTIADDAIGTPLDNVGEYNIKSSKDAKIEVEVSVTDNTGSVSTDNYNHYYTTLGTVHERTFKLPSNGTYVRFEPERDGDLTIWLLQHGSLNYHEGEVLTDKFIRCRPIYFVDEQGNSYKVKEVNGVPQVWSTARLSANWAKIKATADAQGASTTAVTNGWTDWQAGKTIF